MINIEIDWLSDDNKQSLGEIKIIGQKEIKTFPVLGLSWKNNKKNISRIPSGIYPWKKWESPTFKTTVIRLEDVPGRRDILIHPANYVDELRGCMAPGLKLADINGDKQLDVASSRKALEQIIKLLPENGQIKILN